MLNGHLKLWKRVFECDSTRTRSMEYHIGRDQGLETSWWNVGIYTKQGIANRVEKQVERSDLWVYIKRKWDDISTVASNVLKSNSQVAQLTEAKKDIIIYYMYPRLMSKFLDKWSICWNPILYSPRYR